MGGCGLGVPQADGAYSQPEDKCSWMEGGTASGAPVGENPVDG